MGQWLGWHLGIVRYSTNQRFGKSSRALLGQREKGGRTRRGRQVLQRPHAQRIAIEGHARRHRRLRDGYWEGLVAAGKMNAWKRVVQRPVEPVLPQYLFGRSTEYEANELVSNR